MNGQTRPFARGRRGRAILQVIALTMLAVPASTIPVDGPARIAGADPAPAPTNVTKTTAGALTAGTVPDGVCKATVTAVGGGGASSSAATGASGLGGSGASITATFRVVPGQSYGGTVGAGAAAPTAGASGTAPGGAGDGSGGAGGTIVSDHRGGGGGGGTSVSFAGTKVLVAGGGGGGGAAHQTTPVGVGAAGGGGFTGIGAGLVAIGGTGNSGSDGTNTVTGGTGGQAAAGGAGGTNSGSASYNGVAGTAGGNGGNGGPDQNYDSGGGGGGGFTGGGGGASTVGQSLTGGGGGGGASWVRGTSVDAAATVPTGITGASGPATPTGTAAGNTGSIAITWLPCQYDLALTKTVSPASVNAGGKATWTVTVKNNGPDVMTRGDTVTLTDTLPAGPNGAPTPAYKVTGFTVTAGTSSGGLASGTLTCSGVTVGSAMPSSTTCSRAYSAPGAGGAPSGSTRGLDVGEQITITYEQVISSQAGCSTITNTATVKDRPGSTFTPTTDTVNTPLTINCYDLAVTKSAAVSTVEAGQSVTWTVTVTNNGPGPMSGPDDTITNPLIVTETFPGSGVGTSTLTGSTGGAGTCTLVTSTVTCTAGLAAGASQTLTFSTPVNAGTANNTVLTNTATVTDFKSGDSNDSASASVTVKAKPTLNLAKSVVSRANAADQFTVAIKNGATTTASATTSGAGTSASTGATTLSSGTTYTLTDAMAAGSTSVIGQYTKSISCSNSTAGSATVLPSGAGTSFTVTPQAGDAITCTYSNSPTPPTLTLAKSVSSRWNAADQFTVAIKNGATTTASATTSGTGTSATTAATAVTAGTTYTLTEAMAAGSSSTLADYTGSIACTNATTGTGTTLPSGTGTSFSITPAAGDAITCTITNAPGPHLTLLKSVGSRVVAADQFTVAVKNGATTVSSGTTTGTGTSASTGSTALAAGTTYTLTDAMAAGSTSTTSDYLSSISCSNTASGSPTTLPSGSGTSFSVTPTTGDVITCTITNTAKPHITFVKSIASRFAAADQFTVSITHGATTDASATTSGTGATATTGSTALTAGTTYSLSEAMAGGSSSALSDYLGSVSCTNTASGSSTVLPNGTGTSFSVIPANGDNITCTLTNTSRPHLTLNKSITARANSADQFVIQVKNGASLINAATTTGTGTTTSTGATNLATGTSYTLTEAMASGSVSVLGQYAPSIACSNTASGSSTVLPSGSGTSWTVTPLSATDNITCTITNTPGTASLGLTKSASPSSGVNVGATVTYTYGVTNTGTLPLTNVTVTDPHTGLSAITCSPAQGSTLAAGATMSCTATYTVTQTDVDAGSIVNIGTVTGKDPSNNTVTKIAGATVTAAQSASFALSKSASPSTGVVAGDTVTYTISGSNNGTVTLHSVSVSDPLVSGLSCTPTTPATLAPAATISCTGTHVVTQAEVDAGSFVNTATISGLSPSNTPVAKTATATVTASAASSLSLTKSATPTSGVVAGDSVGYTISGRNTGAVTLHNVTVSDPLVSGLTCTPAAPATLAPNATISCTGTHVVTQAEVDAGSFVNTATISGLTPTNGPVSKTANATVTAATTASLSLTKSASPNSGVVAGSTVTYTISGRNTGVVTLHNVAVSDPLVSGLSCTPTTPATLAPNATISCTGTHVVTQAEVNAGSFVNTATVNGLTPTNAPVSKTASATVTATQTASLGLTKVATPNTNVVVGDVVTYTYTGSNTGTVTLHNVTVTDPHAGLSTIGCTPAAPATLAPNATISCTATYTVTQADVDAGSIVNTGTISGLDPANAAVSKTAGATVTPRQNASLSLTKTASPNANVVAGTVVTYSFAGRNTGDVTLHHVGVTDPMSGLSGVSCSPAAPATLAPNATIACTATYTVTQADVDAGSIHNTATISGQTPANVLVSASGAATVGADQTASLGLTKTATPATGVVAGDTVTYTITGTNTGTVTLHNVTVSDPFAGALSCAPVPPVSLAPTATITCTATHVVTQAEVDAGSFVNTATISGLSPTNGPVTKNASKTVTANQTATLGLTKSATPSSNVVAGDVVTYAFHATNTGTVTLHNVAVTDPMSGLSAVSCTPAAPATLAPGAAIDCTATYTVTQADVDAGSIHNTATASGLSPANAPVTTNASKTVTAKQVASVGFVKSGTPDGVVAGQVVTYTLTGTNTGTVTLYHVTVTDPMSGLSAVACVPAAPATLAPGGTITCTATYTVTQADVDAGSIVNTATIHGLDPGDTPVTKSAGTTIHADQVASLAFTKTASPNNNVVAGDVVTYTFHGTNTGTVTVHHVTVTDPMSGLSAITCLPAAPATLAPNATITCTATRTVTQADVDAGSIVNTATVGGLDPNGTPVTQTASTTVTADQSAGLALTKTASPTSGVVAGDVVTYSFHGANTGHVTLHGVTVTDPMGGLSAITCTPGAPATLAPNATIDCTATYTVTQADVDAGSIANTATVSGRTPGNLPVSQDAAATVTADQAASLSLTKTASPDTGVGAGDVVTFSIHGANTGSVTLHGVHVTDTLPGVSALACSPTLPTSLAPGATVDCTATYTIAQADVDAGGLTNHADVTGLDPSGATVTQGADATVSALQVESLGLTKTASPTGGVVAGDVVTYTFTATNTGTVTAHSVTVSDPMPGLSPLTCSPAAGAALAPLGTMACTATYTVTQADVDAGSIVNTAGVLGTAPNGDPIGDTAGATVTTASSSDLTFSKSATPVTGVVAGDVVTYSFHGTNTGAVTLHGVTVTDAMPGLSAIGCTPAAPAHLAPGASIDCTATHTVTQADVDAGTIQNTATLSGLTPTNVPVTRNASFTVTPSHAAGLSLTKSASPSSGVVAGDVVTYTMTATNTGATTLDPVTVSDGLVGMSPLSCTPANGSGLAPGASITCTGDDTVTQADVDAGSIHNTADVTGLDPSSNPVHATATATVTAQTTNSLGFTKTASPSSGVVAGDVVTYTFTTHNTGTTTLHAVAVTDPKPGLSAITCTPGAPAMLAPGATQTCTATYTVTQADVDAGSITNTATAHATPPVGGPFTQPSTATVTTDTSAGLGFTKTASPTSGVKVGDVVTYTFTGTNTGSVSVHGVTVTDPMSGLSAISCTPATPATLAPNATITCHATHTVTQADVDAGSIVNTATIGGLDPSGAPVTNTAGATVTTDNSASIALSKAATPTSNVGLGDVVTYTMTATNTGSVSLHGVTVTDPMPGLSALTCTPAAGGTLAAGATMTCTATHTVTQADVDAGTIVNTATVDALDPQNVPVNDSASRTVLVGQRSSLSLVKTAAPAVDVGAGDTVTYSFLVTNTGSVSAHDVVVTDPMPGLSALTCTPAAPAVLSPGATMTCTATYVVTQADVNAGSIVNTATASGLDPANNPVADSASATVTANQVTALSFTKTAAPATGVKPGQVVTYTMTTRNTGTVTVDNVTIADPMPGLSPLDCTPAQGASLAPGASMTCTATYTVTAADVDAGRIDNTATVSGDSINGHPASNASTAIVPTATSADVDLSKKLASSADGVATWVLTVTNTGTGPYPGPFTVTDPLPDGLLFQSAAGDGWACTGTTTISCTHTDALPVGGAASVTIVTQVTGSGSITNTASMDVGGKAVESAAKVPAPTGGFAFTGAEAERYALVGLFLILAGWFVVFTSRKKRHTLSRPDTDRF